VARVLVVEDDDDLRDMLVEVLAEEGHAVRAAPHGAAALDLLAAAPADVIVTDMKMPVMDGAAFLAAYRARPGPAAPVVGIAASRAGLAALEGAGVDTALAKPFELLTLLAAVESLAPAA
jgi:CheY-like chemotaxis protein